MTDRERGLLEQAIRLADDISDGHFTLLKFTSNYRAGFSTPGDREDIALMAVGKTLAEAIAAAILKAKPN